MIIIAARKCPTDTAWISAQAASTVRSSWLSSRGLRLSAGEGERPEAAVPDAVEVIDKHWEAYYKMVVRQKINEAKNCTPQGSNKKQRVMSFQQRPMTPGDGSGSENGSDAGYFGTNKPGTSFIGDLTKEMKTSSKRLSRAMIISRAKNIGEARELLALLDEE